MPRYVALSAKPHARRWRYGPGLTPDQTALADFARQANVFVISQLRGGRLGRLAIDRP